MYKWENEAIEKYGIKVAAELIEKQKEYEYKKGDNSCVGCGNQNQGSLIELNNGTPFIMHYGMFSYSNGKHRCGDCGKRN